MKRVIDKHQRKSLVKACQECIIKWEDIRKIPAEKLIESNICRPCALCLIAYGTENCCSTCPLYINGKSCFQYGKYKVIYDLLFENDKKLTESELTYLYSEVQSYSKWIVGWLNQVITLEIRKEKYINNGMSAHEIENLELAKERQAIRLQSVRRVEDMPSKTVEEPVIEKERVMRNPIDMYGNMIHNGDYINYPVRHGADMYMRTAKVVGIRERADHVDNYKTVLDIQVAIAPRDYERADDPNWESKVRIKKTTLYNPHRATIIPKTYIHSDKRYRILVSL